MSGRYWDHRTCRWEGGAADDPPAVWIWPRIVDLGAEVPAQPTAEQADTAEPAPAPV